MPSISSNSSDFSTTSAEANTDSIRLSALRQWLSGLPAHALKLETLRPASSDASFRRYFRIDAEQSSQSYIVMDAPQPAEDVRPFIAIAKLFAGAQLLVPEVLAEDTEQGFLLLTDLGHQTFYSLLSEHTKDHHAAQAKLPSYTPNVADEKQAHQMYMQAITALVQLQSHSQPDILPEYDRAFMQRELMIFPEWYIKTHRNFSLNESQEKTLQSVFDVLLANIMAQPQVFVHRDYHSRNLMVNQLGVPGILDFQGALYGPITYDLVSLLRDAYLYWEEEKVLDWAIRYWEQARRAGLPVHPEFDQFYRDFEFMGLQRHLKILGIFARLAHRDGKQDYLKDIPLVMQYVRKTAQRYNNLIPLLRLLDIVEDTAPVIGFTF